MKLSELGYVTNVSHKVTTIRTIVVSEPNIKAKFLGYLPYGSKLNVLRCEDSFAQIEFEVINKISSQNFGYIPISHIRKTDFIYENWVDIAESFEGTPYKWGGRSSFGIDCSGLLQISILSTGQIIPRDTKDQIKYKLFIDIDFEDYQKGDIIFWDGHVGIFLDNDFIIHANAQSMRVSVESLQEILSRQATKNINCIKRLKSKI